MFLALGDRDKKPIKDNIGGGVGVGGRTLTLR